MEKRPSTLKSMKLGNFCLIDDVPCVVDSVQISKPGKHGGAKARVVGKGIFDNVRKEIVGPADNRIDVPIIEKKNMQVLSISGDVAQLMDLVDYSTSDAKIPEDLKDAVKEGMEVIVWVFGSHLMIKNAK